MEPEPDSTRQNSYLPEWFDLPLVIFPDEVLFLLSFDLERSKVELQQQFQLVKQTCYEVPDKNITDSSAATFPPVILQLLMEFLSSFTTF